MLDAASQLANLIGFASGIDGMGVDATQDVVTNGDPKAVMTEMSNPLGCRIHVAATASVELGNLQLLPLQGQRFAHTERLASSRFPLRSEWPTFGKARRRRRLR